MAKHSFLEEVTFKYHNSNVIEFLSGLKLELSDLCQ